ncbi:MAG: phytanoyl-CoA dioxygenase family protein [Actinomycetota bacterium]|nr:phytanoyl-CoA dioxygenase family protein [Actinomycetota bacterium]
MYTLPDQLELLSDDWLAEARRWLEREHAQGRLTDLEPFSLCEQFDDAPPHLGLAGDRATCTVRYDGERVSVERAPDADADLVIEGDYQAAVTSAQWIGIGATAARAAMWREPGRLHGPDALVVRGRTSPALDEVLVRLHDHLGRRTVENPDLHHRARRQGVARHVAELDEHGFTVLEGAISESFADEIRATTLDVLADHGVSSLNWMLYQGRVFERLAQHPTLLTLVDASLGRGAVIGSFSAIRRGPGPGTIPLHTDYSHVPEPYPEWAVTGVGVWAFEDWTEASGPTWVVPGSHKLRRRPRPDDSTDGAVPIEMGKGSVVFFTEGLWHWQGDRTEPGDRITLHWHFNRGIFRSLEPKKLDPQMLHRNAPRLGEMLGTDDWFDKMRGIGRDHERLAHMSRLHEFTDRQKARLLDEARTTSV